MLLELCVKVCAPRYGYGSSGTGNRKGKKRTERHPLNSETGRTEARADSSNGSGNGNDITAGGPRLEPVKSNGGWVGRERKGRRKTDEREIQSPRSLASHE